MSDEPNEYEIKTVEDFLKVPPDRLDLCLKEFGQWVEMVKHIEKVNGIIGVDLVRANTERFVWIDDDKGQMHVHMSVPMNTTTEQE